MKKLILLYFMLVCSVFSFCELKKENKPGSIADQSNFGRNSR